MSGQETSNVVVKPDRNNFNNVSNNFGVILTFSNSCGVSTRQSLLGAANCWGNS